MDSVDNMTVGQFAAHIVNKVGRNSEAFVARQLRTLLQRESIIPTERTGEGSVQTARFDEEAMARAAVILVLNSRYVPHEELKAAYQCLDNVASEDRGTGKGTIGNFARVLDCVRSGEEWFFNFYTSPHVRPSGVLSRKPLPIPALPTSMPGYTTMIVPLSEHVAPLFAEGEAN